MSQVNPVNESIVKQTASTPKSREAFLWFVAGQRVPEVPFPRKELFEVPEFDVGIPIEHHSALRRIGRMPACQKCDSIVRAAQALQDNRVPWPPPPPPPSLSLQSDPQARLSAAGPVQSALSRLAAQRALACVSRRGFSWVGGDSFVQVVRPDVVHLLRSTAALEGLQGHSCPSWCSKVLAGTARSWGVEWRERGLANETRVGAPDGGRGAGEDVGGGKQREE